tara:strand:+ start:345 stop:587 length:243 start_codon:yes stop_codon:yes gene_type:complete
MKTIGWLSAILLATCGIPELIKAINGNKIEAGWELLIMWFLGEVFGLIYVMPLNKTPLVLNYMFNTIVVGALIYFKMVQV